MADETKSAMSRLCSPSLEARYRVSKSPAEGGDAELTKESALGGVPDVAEEFSKEIVFRRSRDHVEAMRSEASRLHMYAASMDDAMFIKFAARLASLKASKGVESKGA